MDEAELRALRIYYSGCTIKTVETDVHALIAEVEWLESARKDRAVRVSELNEENGQLRKALEEVEFISSGVSF